MSKFYRNLKDNFLWQEGAILEEVSDGSGYAPTDDLWDTTDDNDSEYISSKIVENNPEYFERVYKVSVLKQVKYLNKADAKKVKNEIYKEK